MAQLAAAGVRVGLSTGSYENSRHIRWDAGWQVEYGVPYATALAGITSTVADAFTLGNGIGRIIPGTPANFVLWDQDPLTLLSRVQLVATGTNVLVLPRQY
jgi:imidazolonepropionase-like amidohydrolase